jgi:hypothetical protein
MRYLKTFESHSSKDILIVVDVQKSFKKFFNEIYLHELKKYCNNFTNVYQIFDNHVDGKNPNKDYLYDDNPDIPVNDDLYTFPNQKDLIEKRYRYDVDVEFFKEKMSKDQYIKLKSLEDSKKLKIGDNFKTNSGIILIFIPLLTLSADVMSKFTCANQKFGAVAVHHLDKLFDANKQVYYNLLERCRGLRRSTTTTVFIFVSPQFLINHPEARKVFIECSHRTTLRVIALDEVHML